MAGRAGPLLDGRFFGSLHAAEPSRGQCRLRSPRDFPYRLPLSLFSAFTSRAEESVPVLSVTFGNVFLSHWVPNILALSFERLPSSGLYCVFVAS